MKHSIIIPTAGRPLAIKDAVKSLLALSTWDYDAEIIVVDNNTQQHLSDDLKIFCDIFSDKLRYVKEPSPGLGAARHRGIKEAKGEILTFIDDDVEVRAGWLIAIQSAFNNMNVAMVGGPSIPNFTGSIPAWFWGFVGSTPYGGWRCSWLSLLDIGHNVENIDPNYIWGLNFSIRKNVVLACGGFNPDLVPKADQRWQGDGETGLTEKFKQLGYRADYIHGAALLHLCGDDRLNENYFCQRSYYQGVADSYTAIRSGILPSQGRGSSLFKLWMKKIYEWLERSIDRLDYFQHDFHKVKALVDKAYDEGWYFHQQEVMNDPHLLSWVKKDNYWEADIREER